MSGVIATKVGMSRVFLEDGRAVPVTYLKVEPNTVVRCKTEEKDGYNAVVLGIGAKKWKTRKGAEHTRYRLQKEWQVESAENLKPGTQITADVIPAESKVTVTGFSKGRGFQGVIKRHNFSRGPETHGSHHHREPGSVGMCEFPGRILKGKKMPGHMGNDRVTLRGREVVVTNPEEGIVGIKGPIPGPNGKEVFLTFEFEADFGAATPDTTTSDESDNDVENEKMGKSENEKDDSATAETNVEAVTPEEEKKDASDASKESEEAKESEDKTSEPASSEDSEGAKEEVNEETSEQSEEDATPTKE